jgi:hypothetical protein
VSRDLILRRSDLGRLEPLGRGGTAVVYDLPDLTPAELGEPELEGLVYKEYKPKTRAQAGPALLTGLLSLVEFRRKKLADAQRSQWNRRIVWPLRLVIDQHGAALGTVMPLIQPRYFQRFNRRAGRPHLAPRHVELLFGDSDDLSRLGVAPVDQATRLQLIDQIAVVYGMMHFAGIVVGDISGRNLVYDPAPSGPSVLVMDADSARRESTRSAFGSQPHTPHWEPPEVLAVARRVLLRRASADSGPSGRTSTEPDELTAQSKRTDVYKFALLAVRILDHGRGRAVNRDPTNALRILRRGLGDGVAGLLEAMLSDHLDKRPTLREWYDLTQSRAEHRPQPRPQSAPPADPPMTTGERIGRWTRGPNGWIRNGRPDER